MQKAILLAPLEGRMFNACAKWFYPCSEIPFTTCHLIFLAGRKHFLACLDLGKQTAFMYQTLFQNRFI